MSTASKILKTLGAGVGVVAGGYLLTAAAVRRRRHFDLAGKVAIVTGGSRGIGLAIARELVGRGAKVTICARDAQNLAEAEQDLVERGGDVLAVQCDVTQADQIAHVVAETRARFGPIDVLVNNAALITVGPLAHMTLADFRDAMDTIYEAPLLFMLDVLPEMRRRGGGRIVNVASFGGKIPSPHLAPYAAAKHALVGLSETMRTELVPDGIYVLTVCPGLVRSGSALHSAAFKGNREQERAWFAAGDSTPVVSIDAGQLAKRIVTAMQDGDAELITPPPAAIAAATHGVLPGLVIEAATLVNRWLPRPSTRTDARTAIVGDRLGDALLPSPVKAVQERAEDRYQHGG